MKKMDRNKLLKALLKTLNLEPYAFFITPQFNRLTDAQIKEKAKEIKEILEENEL